MRPTILSKSLLLLTTTIFTQLTFAFTLEEATITSIHKAFEQHQLTCVQLVNAYLERIKKYNLSVSKQAPINAYTEINSSVLTDAQKLDDDYQKSGKLSGALHCIPIVLKDNIDSYDTTTTAGSYALLGNQPNKDADITARLRKAGAIILGKGGMDEFAWGMVGFSSRSGRIGNVYNTSKNPGGSSGGSAAAVSANFAATGIGSDNSGSVRIPAVYNGLVGLRPTKGLISQQGMFPMGNIDGTAGPLARTTSDLAATLDVIAMRNQNEKPYVSYLNKHGLQAKKIGIVRLVSKVNPYNKISSEVQHLIDQAIQTMQKNGATFIDVSLPDFDNNRDDNQSGEIEDINHYLSAFPATRKNFTDICESDRTRNFGDVKSCLKFMKSVAPKSSAQYNHAIETINKNKKYVLEIMKANKLDALLVPLSTQAGGNYDELSVNTWQAAVSSSTGLPAIDFIVGYNNESMPVGIDMIGGEFNEGTLIEIAFAYENATHLRRTPTMPEANTRLMALTISQLNNLISVIGKTTYDSVLKDAKPNADLATILTPERFRKIVEKSSSPDEMSYISSGVK